jgi:hypothetical protein
MREWTNVMLQEQEAAPGVQLPGVQGYETGHRPLVIRYSLTLKDRRVHISTSF